MQLRPRRARRLRKIGKRILRALRNLPLDQRERVFDYVSFGLAAEDELHGRPANLTEDSWLKTSPPHHPPVN